MCRCAVVLPSTIAGRHGGSAAKWYVGYASTSGMGLCRWFADAGYAFDAAVVATVAAAVAVVTLLLLLMPL